MRHCGAHECITLNGNVRMFYVDIKFQNVLIFPPGVIALCVEWPALLCFWHSYIRALPFLYRVLVAPNRSQFTLVAQSGYGIQCKAWQQLYLCSYDASLQR